MPNHYNIKNFLKEASSKLNTKKEILFKYTQKISIKTSAINLTNKKRAFNIIYPDKTSYIGIGRCKEYNLKSEKDLINLKRLSYHMQAFGEKENNKPIKLFGGISFNISTTEKYPWEDIPKGLFFIPEFLIKKINTKQYISFFYLINKHSDIDEIQNHYITFINQINRKDNTSNTSLTFNENIPDRNNYSKIFNIYKQKIKDKKIKKSILARIKKFSSNHKILLRDIQSRCTNFYFDFTDNKHFIGSTPELLIEINDKEFKSEAIAGTCKKNKTGNQSSTIKKFLNNKKELLEHKYVINYLVNILSCYTNKISFDKKPKILALEHLYHLHTPIKGNFTKKIHILDLLNKLYPTPAVLGIPINQAKEIITDYEPFDRGWYGGCIGWFDLGGDGRFDVSIRSALQVKNTLFCYAGSGIINESIENNEWEETESKFQHLLSLIK